MRALKLTMECTRNLCRKCTRKVREDHAAIGFILQSRQQSTMADDDNPGHVVLEYIICSPEEMLNEGLRVAGYSDAQINRSSMAYNVKHRFKPQFGCNHVVCAYIWEDLHQNAPEEYVSRPNDLHWFLRAVNFLRMYPLESSRESQHNISSRTQRDYVWYWVERIQALKTLKIVWPEDNYGDDIWIMTVDGTHIGCEEPTHPDFPKDKSYFSHKYKRSAFGYELGLALSEEKLIWMSGPHPAGLNDKAVFCLPGGLREKLQQIGKKGIADGGYSGYDDVLSYPNDGLDDKAVAEFKRRSLQRQEKFNAMIKTFQCLDVRCFRHKECRFGNCLEAVCVICQYMMENLDNVLFDPLVPGM